MSHRKDPKHNLTKGHMIAYWDVHETDTELIVMKIR